MPTSEVVSIAAFVVSCVSFGMTFYFNFRDRANLKVKSTYCPGWADSESYIAVSAVNAGRRPIVVRMWGGIDEADNWVGTFINQTVNGGRLGEHERFDLKITKDDLVAITPDGEVAFVDLWIEDTLGCRYPVVNAKENIKNLRAQ